MINNPKFAVFDVETTGVSASYSDRMVEIAVVLMSADGQIEAEYDTLLNPNRSTGPSWVHGISDEMVVDAPIFADIAGNLVDLFKDRILVGHNITFDLRFLGAEFARIDQGLPIVPTACTLQMARKIGMPKPHKLTDCCRYYGVSLEHAHCALDDTRATAQVLAAGLRTGYPLSNFMRHYQFGYLPNTVTWPILQAIAGPYSRYKR